MNPCRRSSSILSAVTVQHAFFWQERSIEANRALKAGIRYYRPAVQFTDLIQSFRPTKSGCSLRKA